MPLEFAYKPGAVARPAPLVAPHQPRLDWQMWFAALGSYQGAPWLVHFVDKLLEGSPADYKFGKGGAELLFGCEPQPAE